MWLFCNQNRVIKLSICLLRDVIFLTTTVFITLSLPTFSPEIGLGKNFSYLYLALMESPWTETCVLKYLLASSYLKITQFWDGPVSLLYHLKRERCLFKLSQAQQNCYAFWQNIYRVCNSKASSPSIYMSRLSRDSYHSSKLNLHVKIFIQGHCPVITTQSFLWTWHSTRCNVQPSLIKQEAD